MFAAGDYRPKLSCYAPELPTPFTDDDRVDAEAFAQLCELQIEHGASALVVGATTGEAPTLDPAEHRELIRIAATTAGGRVPVIAGAGSNATAHAVELSKDAEANGADAILSVAPYYNKPTQEGLYAHFRAIALCTQLPVILYDDPSRTVRGIADETVARLAELPNIIGLTDATGDAGRPVRLRPLVGAHFRLLSGNDAMAFGFIAQGGDGCISVASNVAPGLCRNIYLAWRQGNVPRARRLAVPLAQLADILSRETNPAPLKYALSLCGLMSSRVRLPLVEPTEQTKTEVANIVGRLRDEYTDCTIENIETSVRSRRRAMLG
jgi:4-hydroxy-tetrahydrodipicolinate synthase